MMLTADTIVTDSELLRPGWFETSGPLVTGVGAGPAPRAADTALGAVTVIPGFVDMHVHGGGSGAFPEATAEATRRQRRAAPVARHHRDGRLAGLGASR